MSYYNDSQKEPAPVPEPTPDNKPAWKPSLAMVALVVAIAGLFMPGGISFDKLPIPIPPFVEPLVDPAKTEGSWVVVVEQTEQRTPEQAKLMRDTAWWLSLEKRGLWHRPYDYDSPDAVPYRKLADEVGMPMVLIILGKGDVGKVLGKDKLTTKEALDAKIKKVTGR